MQKYKEEMGTRCPPPYIYKIKIEIAKIKREIYPQGAKVEIEISHKYRRIHLSTIFHTHALLGLIVCLDSLWIH